MISIPIISSQSSCFLTVFRTFPTVTRRDPSARGMSLNTENNMHKKHIRLSEVCVFRTHRYVIEALLKHVLRNHFRSSQNRTCQSFVAELKQIVSSVKA